MRVPEPGRLVHTAWCQIYGSSDGASLSLSLFLYLGSTQLSRLSGFAGRPRGKAPSGGQEQAAHEDEATAARRDEERRVGLR